MDESNLWASSINQISDKLVISVSDLIKNVKSEEELRIGFEKILTPIQKELEISVIPRYDRTVYKSKRPDAVHGQVIIEYEALGAFRSERWINHALEQLVGYIEAETQASKNTLFLFEPKFQGIGFDGEQIFFTRYVGDKIKAKNKFDPEDFKIDGPYVFNRESSSSFLTYMRALSRLPLTADNLTDSFGPNSKAAPKAIRAFADSLEYWSDQSPRVRTFFNEWKRLFGIVYGETVLKDGERESLTKTYPVGPDTDFQELLFSVHTYFALLMKLIAVELLTFKETRFSSSFSSKLYHSSDDDLKRILTDIEDGGIYSQQGITNFLEGDFFRWYLDALSPELVDSIREITKELSEFEPATTTIDPDSTRDLLKKLYQNLVPKVVRHKLGEYYTPDWLAELLIKEVGYDGNTFKRFLDPACGSGTFPVLAIQMAREYGKKNKEPKLETAKRILSNIWGFDLNPLAVIAARTNYLFALGDLVDELHDIEIPIYLCDSVLNPTNSTGGLFDSLHIDISTSVEVFRVPKSWLDNTSFLKKATVLTEKLVKNDYSPEEALIQFKKEALAFPPFEETVKAFYSELLKLEKEGKNGIWARFLKNAFAPKMAGKFDFVIGNPPWIRWDFLSEDYRKATLQLWKNYGLFSLKGFQTRLGGGKKDFSMLFVYAASDYYLNDGSKLAFLITQEVFKSKGAGEGFRRFQLGENKFLKVIKADDMASIQPFEGATNKTAAIILQKGDKTSYPVPYTVWRKKTGVGKIPSEKLLKEVLPLLLKEDLVAEPLGTDLGSWRTHPKSETGINKFEGVNHYKARSGAYTSPYGVFWVDIKQVLPEGNVLITNFSEKGKREIPKVERTIESDLVFPAIRGSDIQRWSSQPKIFAIISQDPKTRVGYDEFTMKQKWPRTYSYLLEFKNFLITQAAYKKYHEEQDDPFYSQYNVADYTFSKYKVVWKQMTNDLIACVMSQSRTPIGYKTTIPLHTTALIACDDESDAHYLCSIINSKPVRDFVKSFSSSGRGFGTPSVMDHLGISKFNSKDPVHLELSNLSKKLHELKFSGKEDQIPSYERKVDEAVNKLFKII
jgi:hypothetical protein